MPTWVYILGGIGSLMTGAVGSWALLRRIPAEARKLTVDTVDVNVKIAGDLRDDAMEDRHAARTELADLRREFDQYRKDTDARLAELSAELRGEKAENVRLTTELERRDAAIADRDERIDGLQKRVEELEAEVRELKSHAT